MTFRDWLNKSREHYATRPLREATRISAAEFGIGIGRRLGKHVNFGSAYWPDDWDTLIILDACRADLMQDVAPEFGFLPDEVEARYSPASMSLEFLERHTTRRWKREVARTALVSANPFTRDGTVDPAEWAAVDEVWRHSWSDDDGTILPRSVTDAAIRAHRNPEPGQERLIVWYLQPHVPFLTADWSGGFSDRSRVGIVGENTGKSHWYECRDGELSRDELCSAYADNLRCVLHDVELLTENLDGTTVVTSDHANCLGEFGVWGHPMYVPLPTLKRVPWIPLQTTDARTYTPPTETSDVSSSVVSISDRLEALGYR